MVDQSQTEFAPGPAALAFVPSGQVLATDVEDEIVLLDLKSGLYFSLNRVGAFVWRMLDGENTLDDVHRAICRRFDVSASTALADLLSLTGELRRQRLVREA